MADPDTDLGGKVAVDLITEIFKMSMKGLKGAGEWFKSKADEHDFFGIAARKYAEKIEEQYNSMRIFGMNEPIALRTIYTQVNILEKITAQHRVNLDDLEKFFDRDCRRFGLILRTVEGLKVVNRIKKILILGKPGAGKTTFLKYIALQAIDGKLTEPRIPIFIGLKDWSDSGQSLLDFTVKQFDICNFPNAAPFVERMLKKGKCLLLLDGFDEVSGRVEETVVDIRDFADKFSKNQFILSCRIAAYNYCFEKFTDIEIADFNGHQIRTFVKNWFGEGTQKAELCWQKMISDMPIRELAAIPLLLTMLCLAFDETMDFPKNRGELYKEALDALLKKWDASRSIKRDDIYQHLSLRRKESMFSRVAAVTFEKEQYFLSQRNLEKYIEDYIKNLPEAKEETLKMDSEVILKAIEAQHGLFVERAKRIYSFSHLTFQEYFTAKYIVDNAANGTLESLVDNHLTNSKWREVFLLTAGMLDDADNFLKQMKKKSKGFIVDTPFAIYLKEIQKNIVKIDAPFRIPTCRALALYYILLFTNPSDNNLIKPLAYVREVARNLALKFEQRNNYQKGYSLGRYNSDLSIKSEGHYSAKREYLPDEYDSAYLEDEDFYRREGIIFDKSPILIQDHPHSSFSVTLDTLEQTIYPHLASVFARENANTFSEDDLYALENYLKAENLLEDCLKTECYVAKSIRQEISNEILTLM